MENCFLWPKKTNKALNQKWYKYGPPQITLNILEKILKRLKNVFTLFFATRYNEKFKIWIFLAWKKKWRLKSKKYNNGTPLKLLKKYFKKYIKRTTFIYYATYIFCPFGRKSNNFEKIHLAHFCIVAYGVLKSKQVSKGG